MANKWQCCATPDPYRRVVDVIPARETKRVEGQTVIYDRVEVHVVDEQLSCRNCGREIPSPEVRAILGLASKVDDLSERVDALTGEQRPVSPNGSGPADHPADTSEERDLLSPDELAVKLGRSRQWIYEHKEMLGAIKLGSGSRPRLGFDLEVTKAKLAARANGKPEPAPKPKRRRRPSNGSVPLLPVKGRS